MLTEINGFRVFQKEIAQKQLELLSTTETLLNAVAHKFVELLNDLR